MNSVSVAPSLQDDNAQIYVVCLNWPNDEGTYKDYVLAADRWSACVELATQMADEQLSGSPDYFSNDAEKQDWISDRASDSVECSLLTDTVGSGLQHLFKEELYQNGCVTPINFSALRELIFGNRELLLAPTAIAQAPAPVLVPEKIELSLHSVDSGLCRIYYRNPKGGLCCFQLATRTTFDLFHCTPCGEPSHPIGFTNKTLSSLPQDNCNLVATFVAWWQQIQQSAD